MSNIRPPPRPLAEDYRQRLEAVTAVLIKMSRQDGAAALHYDRKPAELLPA